MRLRYCSGPAGRAALAVEPPCAPRTHRVARHAEGDERARQFDVKQLPSIAGEQVDLYECGPKKLRPGLTVT
jgi:hypothetical protein